MRNPASNRALALAAVVLVAVASIAATVCNPDVLKAKRQDLPVLLTPCTPWTGVLVDKFQISLSAFGHEGENESSFDVLLDANPQFKINPDGTYTGPPGFYTVDLYKVHPWFPGLNVLNYTAVSMSGAEAIGNAIAFVDYQPPATPTPVPQPTPTPRLLGTFRLGLTEVE